LFRFKIEPEEQNSASLKMAFQALPQRTRELEGCLTCFLRIVTTVGTDPCLDLSVWLLSLVCLKWQRVQLAQAILRIALSDTRKGWERVVGGQRTENGRACEELLEGTWHLPESITPSQRSAIESVMADEDLWKSIAGILHVFQLSTDRRTTLNTLGRVSR